MNKLAIIAFTLLIALSSMLWFLANGSLNEFIRSQIELQSNYYTGQETSMVFSDFSSSTGTGEFKELAIVNLSGYKAKYAVTIDEARVELVNQPTNPLLTQIKKLTINKLTLHIEKSPDKPTNIEQLIDKIALTLANDYPELYPSISAKIYAQQNPQLDAEAYAQSHPQAGPIVEHTKIKKKRGKPQGKINIAEITINKVELITIENNINKTSSINNVNITSIGGEQGIVTNQLGGEILLSLLKLINQS